MSFYYFVLMIILKITKFFNILVSYSCVYINLKHVIKKVEKILKNLHYIARLFSIGPEIALAKVKNRLFAGKKKKKQNLIDLANQTFSGFNSSENYELNSFFELNDSLTISRFSNELLFSKDKILYHEFNFLGSGWTNASMKDYSGQSGREHWLKTNISSANLEEAIAINGLMTTKNYEFIDWQSDFKSGFRWNIKSLSQSIKYGNVLGADIKVPWELGRLQHLPELALAGFLSDNETFDDVKVYFDEFCSQIIDFVSSNPPRFGTQWMTSMDVAIRAVNMLVAYDLFKSYLEVKNPDFIQIFKKSIYEHGLHIINHTEWSEGMRGNHYLANLAGLIFIAAYLPSDNETDSWLFFGISELMNEIFYQFNEDGGNFEASIPYHFLSSEIVFFSLILLLYIPKKRIDKLLQFGDNTKLAGKRIKCSITNNDLIGINEKGNIFYKHKLIKKINSIGEFCKVNLKSSGNVDLIGDDDSGRFLKFTPSKIELKNIQFENRYASVVMIYDHLAELLEKGTIREKINPARLLKIDTENQKHEISSQPKVHNFKDFGLCIFKNDLYQLSIRCGSVGQKGKGGHSHNDQLSFCLDVKGKEVFVDSGTYCYTSDAKTRNRFRSTASHNTLQIEGMEQNDRFDDDKDDLFWLKNAKSKARIVRIDSKTFIGEHYGYGKPHKRSLSFETDTIHGEEFCETTGIKNALFHLFPNIEFEMVNDYEAKFVLENAALTLRSESNKIEVVQSLYSPEYGILLNNHVFRISTENSFVKWSIKIETD